MPRNILIDPQRTGSGNPNIQFSGSSGNTLRLEVLSEGSVQFTGVSGSLLKISDFPAAGGALNSLFLSGTTAVTGSILPGVSNLYDLGSSSKVWANVFATNISGSLTGSNLTAGQVVVAGTGGILSGTNVFTYDGNLTISGTLRSVYSAGDEGGEIFLTKPQTNTSINTGVTIDMYQNKIRIFESGGTNRGGYFDISSLGAGVATNLVAAVGSSTNYWFESAANTIYTTGSAGVGTTNYTARFYVSGSSTTSVPTALFKAGVASQVGAILDAQDVAGTTVFNVSGSVVEASVPIRNANGSATAPAFSFTGGTSTGMYRRTSGQLLSFAVSGNQVFGVDTNGNFGINVTATTSPSAVLHVSGSSTASASTALFKAGNASPTGPILDVQKSSGASVLVVSGSGKVGIGTQPLISTLQVYSGSSILPQISAEGSSGVAGVAGYNLRLDTTDLWQLITDNNAANGLYLQYNNSSTTGRYFTVTTTGNVGIGTTSPGAKFNSYSSSNGFVGMIAGASYGAKFTSAAGTGMQIAATDPSGVSTYSPLFLQGTNISIAANSNVVSTPTIYADTNQNVGIGQTTTLTARLLVSGSSTAATPTVVIREGVVSPTGGAGTFDVQNSAGTSLLFVSGSGRVGIGSNSLVAAGLTIADVSNLNNIARLNLRNDNSDVGNRLATIGYSGNAIQLYTSAETTGTANNTLALFQYNNSIFYTGTSATNPAERMRIDSSGNVGIGTNAMGDKLAINGSMSVTGSALPGTDSTYNLGSASKRWNTIYASNISGSLTGSNVLAGQVVVAGTGGVLSGTNNFVWDNTNGRVGVGSTAPTVSLDVNGAVRGTSLRSNYHADSAGTTRLDVSSAANIFYTNVGSEVMRTDGSGNVGIGTNSWTGRLYVSGSSTGTTTSLLVRHGIANGSNLPVFDVQNSAGTSLLFVSGSGNIGMGTATPATNLHVYPKVAGESTEIRLANDGTATGNPTFTLYRNAADYSTLVHQPGGSGLAISTTHPSAPPIVFKTGATLTEVMRITGAGNVGIGTTTTGDKLAVNGSMSVTGSLLPGTDNTYDLGSSTKRWRNLYAGNISGSLTGSNLTAGQVVVAGTGGVLSGSNDFFWDNTNKYVGIGTGSPTQALHVRGSTGSDVITLVKNDGAGRAVITLDSGGSSDSNVRFASQGTNKWAILSSPTDLGFYNYSTTSYSMFIAGTTGNVGINTTTSTAKFTVSGSSTVSTPTMVVREGVVSPTGGAGTFDVQNSSGTSLFFVSGSGAVGIGTTVSQLPSHRLHVSGKIGGGLFIDSSLEFLASGNTELKANTDLKLGYALTTVIRSTGNVGVGTLTPSSRLHVYGSSTSTTSTAIIQEGTTPTGGAAALDVQNVSGTSLLFVSGSGRVGIASASPNARLEINLGGSNAEILTLKTTYAADNSYHSMTWRDGSNITGQIDTRYNGTTVDMVFGSLYNSGYNSTERMRITGAGDVGIGTSTYTARLFVSGSSAASTPAMVVRGGVASPTGGAATFDVQNSAGTSILFVTGTLATVGGRVGIGTNSPAATLHVSGTYGGSSHGIQIGAPNIFGLATNNYISLQHSFLGGDGTTQRLVIDSNGNILVGGSLGLVANTARLYVTGSSTASDQGIVYKAGVASPTGPLLDLQTSAGVSVLTVSGSGNVGIGTSLMADKLAVNGTVSVTGSYLSPGVDNSTSLGASNKRWSGIYGTNIYGNLLPTSMTPGSVLYINSSGAVAQDNSNLFWNDSTKNLGVGTASPGTKLSVYGGAVSANYGVFSGSLAAYASSTGALYTYWNTTSNYGTIVSVADNSGNAAPMQLRVGGTLSTHIDSSGNVGIGTTTPYGSKLAVYGGTLPSGGSGTSNLSFASNLSAGRLASGGGGSDVSIINTYFDSSTVELSAGTTSGYVSGIAIGARTSPANDSVTIYTRSVERARIYGTSSLMSVTASIEPGVDNTYNLGSSSKRWNSIYAANISGSFTGSNLTAGQVVVAGTGGVLSGSNNFWWDNSNGNVGIGTSTYTARLFVSGSSTASTPTMVVREGVASPTGGAGVFSVQNSAGTSLLFVSGSGYVGVGITNPTTYKLDVVGQIKSRNLAAGDTTGITLGNNGSERARIQFTASDDSARFKIEVNSVNASSERLSFYAGPLGGVATNEAMIIGGNGNVGIGTGTLATSRLLVTGSGATSSTSTMHLVNSSNSSLFFVRDDGNVGIGSSSPGYTLQVGSGASVGTRTLALIDSGYGIVIKGGNGNGIVQSLGTTVPLELQAGNGNNGNYVFSSTGNVGIGTATPTSKLHIYTTQNDATATPSVDVNAAFIRIGDPTTGLSFNNGLGIKLHDGGTVHYSIGQLSGSFVISQTSDNGNVLFSSGRTDGIVMNSSGFVGLGTTLMDSRLVVAGTSVFSGSANPDGDLTRDLGTTSKRWRNLYAGNISGSLTGSNLTAGQVVVAGTGGVISGSNNFWWDNNNGNVGIGTSTYAARLFVSGSSTASTPTMVVKEGVVSPTGGAGAFDVQNSAGTSLLFVSGSGFVGIGTNTQNATAAGSILHVSSSRTGNASSEVVIGAQILGNSSNLYRGNFQFFQLANGTETMRIDSSGNAGIGTNTTNGNKLSVNGQTAITGSLLPGVDNTYDLGSTSKRWKTIYAATGSISNVVFSPVSTGATYSTTFASGESGRLTATKTIAAATNTTFFTVSANNGASMFDVAFVVSESGFSVARKYSVAAQYGTSSSNVVTFKTVDTGPYSGYDLTVTFTKSSGTVTTCTVSHNYTTSTNIAMTIDVSAISSGGAPTTVTIF